MSNAKCQKILWQDKLTSEAVPSMKSGATYDSGIGPEDKDEEASRLRLAVTSEVIPEATGGSISIWGSEVSVDM